MSHPAFELSLSNLFHWMIFLVLLYNMFDFIKTYLKRGNKIKSQDNIIAKYKHIVKERDYTIKEQKAEIEVHRARRPKGKQL